MEELLNSCFAKSRGVFVQTVSVVVALALAAITSCCRAGEPQGTLKKIIETKTIRLGYQKSLAPFSFAGADGRPSGYSIDLCHRIVAGIRNELALGLLDIEWIEVTVANRFQRVADGEIDLECAVAGITLSRLRQVDFSAMIWIDSKTFLVKRGQSVKTLADLARKRVAVLANTTTEKILREVLLNQVLDGGAVTTEVVLVDDHREGLDALVRGSVDAVASDRMVLARLAAEAPDPQQLSVADYQFAYEPLALTLRRNDADFKVAVNQVLARLYRTGAVKQVYKRWFSDAGPPPPLLDSLYDLNGLRD
jgi:polar amino acid transport system substrate-binding protein/glutamate/aspartate transport system substrate-binding protein